VGLVVVKGDPATAFADIENVEIAFQGGVGVRYCIKILATI